MVDETGNRFARDLIEAIHAAVEHDPSVQACKDRARAAGFDLRVSLDAVVGVGELNRADGRHATVVQAPARRLPPAPRPYQITEADRRFLRSLRIAGAETATEV